MTDQHPITPPPELVQQWLAEGHHQDYCSATEHAIAQAARWGADQELEACCEWVNDNFDHCISTDRSDWLRAARRPKPPSLKKQALKALEDMLRGYSTESAAETIRCFIKSLPDES